MTTIQKH